MLGVGWYGECIVVIWWAVSERLGEDLEKVGEEGGSK